MAWDWFCYSVPQSKKTHHLALMHTDHLHITMHRRKSAALLIWILPVFILGRGSWSKMCPKLGFFFIVISLLWVSYYWLGYGVFSFRATRRAAREPACSTRAGEADEAGMREHKGMAREKRHFQSENWPINRAQTLPSCLTLAPALMHHIGIPVSLFLHLRVKPQRAVRPGEPLCRGCRGRLLLLVIRRHNT